MIALVYVTLAIIIVYVLLSFFKFEFKEPIDPNINLGNTLFVRGRTPDDASFQPSLPRSYRCSPTVRLKMDPFK